MKKNKYIYIVLVRALTNLGTLARILTKYEYTHIAVSFDDKLEEFITFSRKKHYTPFDSGFMKESLDCYAFGNNKEVKLKIFKLPITSEQEKNIKDYIKEIENDDEYLFNIYSMITMPILHGIYIHKTHNCMSFVSKIISFIIPLDKKYYKYNIKEIDNLLTDYFYEEKYYKKTKTLTKDYMNKKNIFYNTKSFIILNFKLIKRIFIKR